MSVRLHNVTTSDDYSESTTLHQPETVRAGIQVANAAVYYELDKSEAGNGLWGGESFLLPTVGSLSRVCSGIRFRSALAGSPAQVSAELLNLDDIAEGSDSLAPFSENVSPAGAVTGGAEVTGTVAANGTVTAGLGFSVNRTAAGIYAITFTTPFTSAPACFATLLDVSAAYYLRVRSVTAAGFTVESRTSDFGQPGVDNAFHFLAHPIG